VLLTAILMILMPVTASSSVPSPRVKPSPPAMSVYMGESDAKLFRRGLNAAKARRWSEVEKNLSRISDPVAKDTLRWIRATNDRNAPIETLEYVHKSLGDWPRMVRVRAEAERRMFSGEGRAALARAYYAKGDSFNGDKYLRLAWNESRLTRDRQKKIFRTYRSKLTKADHAARADGLEP